jgi:hypothetical protein
MWSYWSPSEVTNHSVSEAGYASVFKGEVREAKHTVSGPLQTADSDPLDHCQCPKFQTDCCLKIDESRSCGK